MPVMSFLVFPSPGNVSEAFRYCQSLYQSDAVRPDQSEHEMVVLTLDRKTDEQLSADLKKLEEQPFVSGVSLVSAYSEEEMKEGGNR